jgi:fructose/tagatose bisphosphate aldolase
MEYVQKICIEREDLNNLLASGHDCTTYLHMSIFFTTILGFSLVGTVLHALSLQKEIDGINQVKKSLMDHIVTLEAELTALYANEDGEEEEQEEEQEDATETKHEELDDLAEDTKPHVD